MIDMFALLLTHSLIFIAAIRLMTDDAVDVDPALTAVEDPSPEEELDLQ